MSKKYCPKCRNKDVLYFVKDESFSNWKNPERVWGLCPLCLHEWDTNKDIKDWEDEKEKK